MSYIFQLQDLKYFPEIKRIKIKEYRGPADAFMT